MPGQGRDNDDMAEALWNGLPKWRNRAGSLEKSSRSDWPNNRGKTHPEGLQVSMGNSIQSLPFWKTVATRMKKRRCQHDEPFYGKSFGKDNTSFTVLSRVVKVLEVNLVIPKKLGNSRRNSRHKSNSLKDSPASKALHEWSRNKRRWKEERLRRPKKTNTSGK